MTLWTRSTTLNKRQSIVFFSCRFLPCWLTLSFDSHYEQGYKDGFDHGRLHGLFEGRAIGQEKAFEIWEEVGYIEGTALFWQSVISVQNQGGVVHKKVSSRYVRWIQLYTGRILAARLSTFLTCFSLEPQIT